MNVQACIDHLQQLAEQTPRYPDSWYNLALVLSHVDRHADALTAANRALEIHPQYFDAGIAQCFLLGETGEVEEGFRAFRRLHVRSPEDFGTVYAFGFYCMRHGWKKTGLAQLLKAERLHPNAPHVLLSTAAALLQLGDERSAQARIEKAKRVLENLGAARLCPDMLESAAQVAADQPWRNPKGSKVHVILSDFYSAAGETEAAEGELLEANRRYPGHAHLMTHTGRSLRARGRLEEAEKWLSVATLLDDGCNHAYFELGFVHAEKEDWARASSALQAAVDLRPLYPDYRFHLGVLLLSMGQVNDAIDQFRLALTINPYYGHAALQLASGHAARREWEQTLRVLSGRTCAEWPEALILAAEAHLMSGRRTEAHRCLEKAISIDGSHGEAREMLESIQAEPQVAF